MISELPKLFNNPIISVGAGKTLQHGDQYAGGSNNITDPAGYGIQFRFRTHDVLV